MMQIIWLVSGAAVAALAALCLWQADRRRRRRRIAELTEYLEAAVVGRQSSLARVEDELSMLEDELYKTVSELRIAKEAAQHERQQQADNLADIAHQLKTPLTSMSLMTQLLGETATDEQQEYLNRLGGQLTRMDWLTASLLTMSKLDAGTVNFACGEVSFEELAAQAVEPLEQLLHSRGQSLGVAGGGVMVSCDLHWTAEALVNLIKNCSEHTPEGGTVELAATVTPLYTQIVVQDSGQGFAAEDIPHLFRRFYRGRGASKDSIGIGLALCRAIVEGQQGIVRAENRPEGGARFVIRFYL